MFKKLKEKYYSQGLRIIMVATQDPKAASQPLGFVPDDLVADPQGHIAKLFGVGNNLPSAYLWSWQGGGICENACAFANDGDCDDGGRNSDLSLCALGSDCADCGPR